MGKELESLVFMKDKSVCVFYTHNYSTAACVHCCVLYIRLTIALLFLLCLHESHLYQMGWLHLVK